MRVPDCFVRQPRFLRAASLLGALVILAVPAWAQRHAVGFGPSLANALDGVVLACEAPSPDAVDALIAEAMDRGPSTWTCILIDADLPSVRQVVDAAARTVGAESTRAWFQQSSGAIDRTFRDASATHLVVVSPAARAGMLFVEVATPEPLVETPMTDTRAGDLAAAYRDLFGGMDAPCEATPTERGCALFSGTLDEMIEGLRTYEPMGLDYLDGAPWEISWDPDDVSFSYRVRYEQADFLVTWLLDTFYGDVVHLRVDRMIGF